MALLYPATLPQTSQWKPYGEDTQDNVLETEMDQGPAKKRLLFTAVSKFYTINLQLTSAEYDILESFYESDTSFGTLPFEWIDFRSGTLGIEYYFKTRPTKMKTVSQVDYDVTFILEKRP
jgi:hypothetical protein